MKLLGRFIDIICKVNPDIKTIVENDRKVLYMEILHVIYGCIWSALRWYEFYSETTERRF